MRICCVLVLLALAAPVTGQTFAVDAFYRFGTLTTVDREPGAINQFSTSGAGTSLEQIFGIGPSIELAVLPSLSLRGSLYGGAVTGSFVSDPYFAQDSTSQKHFEVTTSAALLEAALMPVFRLGDVRVAMGPSFDLFLARSRTVQELQSTLRGTTTDTTFSVASATIGRLALNAELGYVLPLLTRPVMAASLRYDPYVNRYRSFGEAIQTGVALHVPLTGGTTREATIPVPAPVPIGVRVGDRDLSRDSVLPVSVSITDRLMYQELPLQFNIDSVTFLPAESVNRFAEGDIDPESGVEHEVLNVLASRLKSRPAAVARVRSSAAAAMRVVHYLRNIWHLPNSVVVDSARDLGHDVLVSTDDAVVLLPVSLHVIERSLTIPRIVIETGDSSPYDLTIAAGQDTLLRKVGVGGEADNSVTILPANVDVNKPLTFTVAQESKTFTRTVTLRASSSARTISRIEVTFRPSFQDMIVLQNRELLFTKLGGTRIQSTHVYGKADKEVQSILDWLGQADEEGTQDFGPWRLKVVSEME